MRPSSPSGARPARPRVVAPLSGLAALTALTMLAAALAGCGPATPATLPGAAIGPRASAATPEPGPPTSTSEVNVERDGMDPAVVTAVRYAAHPTYDRLVIDLDGDIPGYNLKWVDEFVQDGSGRAIDVRGGAYLQLTLFPASAHDEDGTPTWKGGPIYPADLGNLTDVVRTGDFEGRVGIGLVLARQAAFQIEEQGGPNRLVLDVAH
ncbi:hypothetical protein [Nonomuraea sp. NPDC050783]|uniref:AMIN-like domain-containing (lipo)protein n=1 Tax=Nonomuraea sp. NPDC050783 TaxID=3154634 RepID=UPI0034668A83